MKCAAALVGTGIRISAVIEQPGDGLRAFVLGGVHKRLVEDLLRDVTCGQPMQLNCPNLSTGEIEYVSHEFYRIADGLIAEEWICSDMATLLGSSADYPLHAELRGS